MKVSFSSLGVEVIGFTELIGETEFTVMLEGVPED